MKKSSFLFMLTSIILIMLISIHPIIKIYIEIKPIQGLFYPVLAYNALIVIFIILLFIELVYCFTKLYLSDYSIFKKILWTFLLPIFSIFIMPYFYSKYVLNKSKLLLKTLLYIFIIILLMLCYSLNNNIYNKELNKKNEEIKKIEEEVNHYSTKDGVVDFSFGHGYESKEVGEYDLYVINEKKNIVFTAFTYETYKYEQKSADQFIEKAISDLSQAKEDFKEYKAKEVYEDDDKVITTVIYEGKKEGSSVCIYKISSSYFKSKGDYIVSTIEIVTKSKYKERKKELDNILKSMKLN